MKKLTLSLLAMSAAILMITSVYAPCSCIPQPPCHPCEGGGKVTGGGQIPIAGGEASFGFNAMWFSRNEFPNGELEYVDHVTGDKVHAHLLEFLVVWEDNPGNKPHPMLKAYFDGPCTFNHEEGYRFWVYVEDDGEPSTPDHFSIVVWEEVGPTLMIEEAADLLHGNIQIHKPPK